MRLVEEGKIDLDAPVDNYLTRWQLPPSSHIHDEGTARQLLSHTAGLALWNYPGAPVDAVHPTLVGLLSGAGSEKGVELTQQPGLKYTYLEDITGETFPVYMRLQVLQSLGMSHSTYLWLDELRSVVATCYERAGRPVELSW